MIYRKYEVYTPVSRFHNFPNLIAMLEPMEIQWNIIYGPGVKFCHPELQWIKAFSAPQWPSDWHPAPWKANWFLDHVPIDNHAMYLQLSDDDRYEPEFFQKVDDVDGDVLIVTMVNAPTPAGGRTTLIACKENLRGSRIGGQQIIVKGDIIRHHRYGSAYDGDWNFIESVTRNNSPVYIPDATVFWNSL